MMLSRLACILIRVYAPQVAAGQPVAARHGRRQPRRGKAVPRPALVRVSLVVADRRSIAQHVWDNEADAFGSNTIDVHLARLRAKLAGAGVRIETVRGVGYRITPL